MFTDEQPSVGLHSRKHRHHVIQCCDDVQNACGRAVCKNALQMPIKRRHLQHNLRFQTPKLYRP